MKRRFGRLLPQLVVVLAFLCFSQFTAAKSVVFWTQSSTSPWLYEVLEDFTRETGIEVQLGHIGFGVEELYVA